MYSRKSVGPWGLIRALRNSSINRIFLWRLPIQSHSKQSITEKDKIKPNICPEIPLDLRLWRRLACETLRKVLYILTVIARVDPDLLEVLSTVGTSTVNWQDLKQDSFENNFPLDILNSSARMYESM